MDLNKSIGPNLNLKSVDLKNIYEWPLVGRLVVYFLVSLGVFYFGYFFDFSNQGDVIFQHFKQEQDLKQQMESILKNEEKMQEEVSQYPEIVKTLNLWQEQFISGDNLPDLLNQILKIGATNHIQFSIFAPGTKKQEGDYWMVPIKVVMQGNYSQVATFISQVANLSQLVAVSNFVILKQAASALGPKVDAAAAAAAAASASSGATPEEAIGPQSDRLTCQLMLEVYYLANKK